MDNTMESVIQRKIQKFTASLLLCLEKEKEWEKLDQQGKTWNVVGMDGTILSRGIRNYGFSVSEDQRLWAHE